MQRDGARNGAGARERVMSCAVRESMDKGFNGASLRTIAAAAEVTTGAIYGYFPSKEALFDAIVAPAGDELLARYIASQERFYALPFEDQTFEGMQDFERGLVHEMLDFVYDHRGEFLLIFAKSAGTSWETYMERFVDVEEESTHRYTREMRERGVELAAMSPATARILSSMFFRGYFEPLLAGMPRGEAHGFIADYERFFHAGYVALMEPQQSEDSKDAQ